MARRKRKIKGLQYFGRKAETSNISFEKELFIPRTKSLSLSHRSAVVDVSGKFSTIPTAVRPQTLGDNNDALNSFEVASGILLITPTSNRTKATPTASELISTSCFTFTERYHFADIVFINLAAATHKLTISAGTDVTLTGNLDIEANSSATFRFVTADLSTIKGFRIS